MGPELTGGLLGVAGGLLSGALAAFATITVHRAQRASLENDEIRRRKVEVIFNLLGSRYVLINDYPASSEEVQVFNTAMALFSVYFNERTVKEAYDRFLTNKTDANLIEMLKVAAQMVGLDLLPTHVSRVMVVKSRNFSVKTDKNAGS